MAARIAGCPSCLDWITVRRDPVIRGHDVTDEMTLVLSVIIYELFSQVVFLTVQQVFLTLTGKIPRVLISSISNQF